MKLILALLLALVGLLFSAENLVQNPGFEAFTGGKPEIWQYTLAKDEPNALEMDNAEFHSGKAGIRIRHQKRSSYTQVRQAIKLKPNTDYVASIWIKGESIELSEKGLGAKLFLSGQGGVTLKASDSFKGTFAWKKVSLSFNSGSLAETALILYLHEGSGTVWFDEAEILEGKDAAQASSPASRALSGVNLALGKKYTMSRAPNYGLCTDPDDAVQLTDGQFTEGYFWVQKSTVGWMNAGRVEIVIDLGRVEPIRELSLGTAGGATGAGVNFPDAVFFVSEDGKNFYNVGRRFGSLMPDKKGEWYATRYHLNDLKTKGRYVAVSLVANGSFMFADEIEVIQGEFPAATVTLMGTTYSVDNLATAIYNMRKSVRDQASLRSELAPLRDVLSKRGESFAKEIAGIEKEVSATTDIAELAALREKAGVLHAKAVSPRFPGKSLVIHGGSGWNDFSAFDSPAQDGDGLKKLSLVMGADEYESVSFGVFNVQGVPAQSEIEVSDLTSSTGKIPKKNIVLRYGENVECNDGLLRPDALPLADGPVPVAAGNNRAFWVQVRTQNTPAGDYLGTVSLSDGKNKYTVALQVAVLPVFLPKPIPLATYNWGYTSFAPVMADVKAAANDLASHYINTAVVHPSQMPKFSFDDSARILSADFSKFDEVIKLHTDTGIRKFFFFCYFGDIGNGLHKPLGDLTSGKQFKLNSGEWKTAMKSLTARWVEHCVSLGLSYEDYAVYPIDEPNDKLINGGGRDVWAIFKEADARLRVFVDPTAQTSVPAMRTIASSVDIWCPHLDQTLDEGRLAFFAEEKRLGKSIHAYNCKGPDKTFHPLGHYRRMLWQVWEYGFTGAGHWNYADTGYVKGEKSAWTDFDGGRVDFSIVYDAATAPQHVTKKEVQIPSRRWEAWRDGVEEFGYLSLLKGLIAQERSKGNEAATAAEKTLQNTVKLILTETRDSGAFAAAHRRILEAIVSLSK